jgi:two-component sensor histidine kinase
MVQNALKHAFPDGRAGTIRVVARRNNGDVVLEVADDGVGVPVQEGDGGAVPGFGQLLTRTLARQLSAQVETVPSERGLHLRLVAPMAVVAPPDVAQELSTSALAGARFDNSDSRREIDRSVS